jgi:hypothetical protein
VCVCLKSTDFFHYHILDLFWCYHTQIPQSSHLTSQLTSGVSPSLAGTSNIVTLLDHNRLSPHFLPPPPLVTSFSTTTTCRLICHHHRSVFWPCIPAEACKSSSRLALHPRRGLHVFVSLTLCGGMQIFVPLTLVPLSPASPQRHAYRRPAYPLRRHSNLHSA